LEGFGLQGCGLRVRDEIPDLEVCNWLSDPKPEAKHRRQADHLRDKKRVKIATPTTVAAAAAAQGSQRRQDRAS
jgi:hypothetical protein